MCVYVCVCVCVCVCVKIYPYIKTINLSSYICKPI